MAKPFRGVINVDVTQSVPDWEPYTQPIAPEGTPSVLYIVLDDVGYSAMGPYGGLIETPNIDRIAQRGLTYTNFHTTALCSPTRSCLTKPRNRYVYYPGTAEVPESVAPNIRNRSYTIAVEVTFDSEDASGVLFAHGAPVRRARALRQGPQAQVLLQLRRRPGADRRGAHGFPARLRPGTS
jgi:hypothetical protein